MAGPDVKLRIPIVEPVLAHVLGPAFMSKARSLTEMERLICRLVFGSSVNPELVLVGPTVVALPGQEDRPYTFGNRILVPVKTKWEDGVLVHELTHVWQFQNSGGRYMSDSFSDQVLKGSAAAYSIAGESNIVPRRKLASYEVEEQAMIVEGFYRDLKDRVGGNGDLAAIAKLSQSENELLTDSRRGSTAAENRVTAVSAAGAAARWWRLFSSNPDVIRMIGEVRQTMPLSSLQQYVRDSGPRGPFDTTAAPDTNQRAIKIDQTLPILQVQW